MREKRGRPADWLRRNPPVAASDSSPAVEVTDLHFAYPGCRDVLRGISFSIHPRESVAIIGPNGAGKSTLALHLNGLLRGDGVVRILGLAVSDRTVRDIRTRVGLVFQDPDDQLFLTSVGQDVAFGPSNMGLSRTEIDERVSDALAAVGMDGSENRLIHHLSSGEKKRVALATTLAMRPDVLILDEPSANLDPKARRRLMQILKSLPVTKIIITHDLPLAYELCPRALLLSEGMLVADSTTPEMLFDQRLLAANDLELPYAFGPQARAEV